MYLTSEPGFSCCSQNHQLTVNPCTQAVLSSGGEVVIIALSIASAVLAPAVEELIYRGFLLRSLTRYMPAPVAVRHFLDPAASSSAASSLQNLSHAA